MRIGFTLLWAALLLAAAAVGFASQGNIEKHDVALYQQGSAEDGVGCNRSPGGALCGTRRWPQQSFKDCSDAQFRCVFDEFNVMAVPKSGDSLHEGQVFTVFGATLTVQRCLAEQGNCDVAMISSTCADDAVCSCRRPDIGKSRIVFFYARERGVTAFYSDIAASAVDLAMLDVASAELNDAIPLRTFVLVANEGFLNSPFPEKGAKLVRNCEAGRVPKQ